MIFPPRRAKPQGRPSGASAALCCAPAAWARGSSAHSRSWFGKAPLQTPRVPGKFVVSKKSLHPVGAVENFDVSVGLDLAGENFSRGVGDDAHNLRAFAHDPGGNGQTNGD